MSDPNEERLRRLFDLAFELPEPVRPAFVSQKCARDPELERRLRAMLAAAGDTQFREPEPVEPRPSAPTSDDTAFVAEQPGSRLGPYHLLQQLGEGGFGVVFLAEQTEPVARRVALKIIKLGMDTRQVVARFEQERQALALMDHPNIAMVFDAGATATGRPYFVMELCKGDPIVEYCERHSLTIDDRLRLMAQVCQAVQHAHQKGIIHRDLKPSNILVGMQDGRPVAKVIDFGIAKATLQPLTDKTLLTEAQEVIGTLQYMSPEQAEGSLDIDTRTDIYALGVLLYELLTGSTPFDESSFRGTMPSEMRRMIREVEPRKPSTRIDDSRATLAELAARRRVEPRRLGTLVRGELDWIVMKAIEKDRTRRYESASALALDLGRYLDGETVLAAPPSPGYRLRKLVRRNKGVVTAAAAVAIALLIGVVGFAWQASIAAHERDLAIEAQTAEAAARAQAEAVAELMESVFEGIDPAGGREFGLSIEEQIVARLDRLATELESSATDPLAKARLSESFGKALFGLSEYEKSAAMFDAAVDLRRERLGPGDPDTLAAALALAGAHQQCGRFDEALRIVEELQAQLRANPASQTVTEVDVDHLLGMIHQAAGRIDEAITLHEETRALLLRRFAPDHAAVLNCTANLAITLGRTGRAAEGTRLLEETRRLALSSLGPESGYTLRMTASLAQDYLREERHADAAALLEPALETLIATFGPSDDLVQSSRVGLARAWQRADRSTEAMALFETAIAERRRHAGEDDAQVLRLRRELAMLHRHSAKLGDAIVELERVLDAQLALLGPEHADTLATRHDLGCCYYSARRAEDAIAQFEVALPLRRERSGPESRDTLQTQGSLGAAYWALARYDLSIPLIEDTLAKESRTLGVMDAGTLGTAENLGINYLDSGRTRELIDHLTVWLPRLLERNGHENPSSGRLATAYLRACQSEGRMGEAVPVLESLHGFLSEKLGAKHPVRLQVANNLAAAYWHANRPDLAVPLLEDVVAHSREVLGEDDADTLTRTGSLGVNLRDAGRLEEAVTVLRAAVERAREAGGVPVSTTDFLLRELATTLSCVSERRADAIAAATAVAEAGRASHPAGSAALASALAFAGTILVELGAPSEAEAMLRECLEIRERTQPEEWTTFHVRSVLGGALLELDRHADAEPLLLRGYEGVRDRASSIPAKARIRLAQAATRLAELYEATGRKEQAAGVRAEVAGVVSETDARKER